MAILGEKQREVGAKREAFSHALSFPASERRMCGEGATT